MKELYEKLLELLGEIEEIRYIDLDAGQLQIEKPPLSYPAVLIKLSEKPDEFNHRHRTITGYIELTVVNKYISETHNLAPEQVRERGLKYLELNEKIDKVLQGYRDNRFEPFSDLGKEDRQIRTGLKTIIQKWETAWKNVPSN